LAIILIVYYWPHWVRRGSKHLLGCENAKSDDSFWIKFSSPLDLRIAIEKKLWAWRVPCIYGRGMETIFERAATMRNFLGQIGVSQCPLSGKQQKFEPLSRKGDFVVEES
jgi:hypothetical protein